MSHSWINLTPSLSNGIKSINAIDSVKFSCLLSRLFKPIPEPFTQEESNDLEKSLNVSNIELKLLLDCLIHITEQSQHFLMKPTVLEEELIEQLHFDADKAQCFVKYWTENTKLEFNNLQSMKKVQNISWELNLETGSDCDLKKTVPVSSLQFQIKDSAEKITVELNEDKLLELYEDIENIQSYLDNIK